jgi:hypothetical protein
MAPAAVYSCPQQLWIQFHTTESAVAQALFHYASTVTFISASEQLGMEQAAMYGHLN